MKAKRKITICASIIAVMILSAVIFVAFSDNGEQKVYNSLSEYYYALSGCCVPDKCIAEVREIHGDVGYNISIDEYFLDRATGIGCVKCSVSSDVYELYRDDIKLHMGQGAALSEYRMFTENNNGVTYLYFAFIANLQPDIETPIKLYYEYGDNGKFFELDWTNERYSRFVVENNDDVFLSGFGIRVIGSNGMESLAEECQISESTNYSEGMLSLSVEDYSGDERTAVYCFRHYMDDL